MKIEQITTKRNYLPLILFIFSIGACMFFMEKFKKEDSYLNLKKSQKIDEVIKYNRELQYADYGIYQDGLNNLDTYYALVLFFFVFILFLYIAYNNSIWIAVVYLILSWLIITEGEGVSTNIYKTELETYGFIKFILFSPYLFYIYLKSIKGKIVDNTNVILYQNQSNYNQRVNELSHLKEKQIISDEQYSDKFKKLEKDKIRKEFYLSKEFKALESLRNSNVFTKEEFEIKIEEIIEQKFNKK